MADGTLRSIDLFAGCGGLSLGLHRAGWEGVFAIERDPMAFETLRANLVDDGAPYAAYQKWPDWLPVAPQNIDDFVRNEDYRQGLRALRGTIDLVAGGPPCQGFSVGGKRNGDDERNHLVHRQLDVVAESQPRAVLIENVEGITRAFQSRPREGAANSVAAEVVEALGHLGYDSTFGIADASRFGVPQTRRRALIVAFRSDTGVEPASFFSALEDLREGHVASLGLPVDRAVTAKEALDDLVSRRRVVCPDSEKFESSTYRRARNAYAVAMRGDIPDGSIPDSHRYTKHGERILELYMSAHATQPKGRLSKEFLLASGTKKDKKVLIDPKLPVSTITTHPDEFIHYAEPRNITVREMARLQSFPDDYRFKGRYTINGPRRKFDVARCSQVGNAVPPYFAQAVGAALRKVLGA